MGGKHVSLIISAPRAELGYIHEQHRHISVNVTASSLRDEFAWKTSLVIAGVKKIKNNRCMGSLRQQIN